MDVVKELGDLVSAKQKEVDTLNAVIQEVQSQAAQAPVADADQDQMKKLQDQIDAVMKERDGLRAAIQVEVDDRKADTERLEKAIAPLEEAPKPEVPVAPASPAPETPVEAAPVADAPVGAPVEEAAPDMGKFD